jgi:hypothetical protein
MIGNTIISTLKLMIFIMDRKAISQNEFTGADQRVTICVIFRILMVRKLTAWSNDLALFAYFMRLCLQQRQ